MAGQMQDLVGRLGGAVKGFTLAQRTLAIIGVAVLVLGAVALSSWLARPTLTPLFSGLSGTDAAAVVDELSAAGVAYELADGGSTVLVPAKDVYRQRVAMAAAGLPADVDGAGYSLLDDMPMTSSEFQQETTYRRAVEGELARTISAMDGVDTATVRLAIPEDTVFVEETAAPTASVFIRPRTGATLSGDQVQAVVHLVSAGVPGMAPADVAVVDASGTVLSAVGEEPGTGRVDERTAAYEERVRAAVQALLDPLVGRGNAAVTVSAELDMAETQRTVEEFSATPDTPPLGSSTRTEEYTGTGGGAAGVLGPDNIAVPQGGQGEGTYRSENEDVTNAVNKSTEVTRLAPGGVVRQSVSVAVNTAAAGAIDMASLQAAVAAAAGVDTERGDTLSVQRMAFDTTAADAAQEALAAADAAEERAAQSALVRQAAIAGVVLLLAVVVAVALARRSRRARREAVDLGQLETATALPMPSLEGPDEDDLPVLPPAPVPVEPDPAARKRAEVTALADEDPAEVAELLRGWMSTSGARR